MFRRLMLPALVITATLAFAQVSSGGPYAGQNTTTDPQTQSPSTTTTTQTQTQTAPTQTQTQGTPTSPESPTGTTTTTSPTNSTTQSQTTGTTQTAPNSTTQSTTTPTVETRTNTASSTMTPGTHSIAAGTEIHAVLDTPLSTKTSNVGDRFTATVNDPVMGNDGSTAIPAGSKISGEVVQADQGKMLPSLRGKGSLNLRFDQVMLPSGKSFPLHATLQSVTDTKGKQTASANSEGQVQGGMKGTTAAKDVGIGAGVGTLAGLIFGSALKGLAVGAIAGGGYVLATQGKDVNIPAQSGLVLKLDQPLTVSSSGGSTGGTTP